MRIKTPNVIASCESLYLSANILLLTHSTWDASWNLSFRLWVTPGHVSCCHNVLLQVHFTVIFNSLKSDIITVGFPIVTFQRGTSSRRSVHMEFKVVISYWGCKFMEAQSESYNSPKVLFTLDKKLGAVCACVCFFLCVLKNMSRFLCINSYVTRLENKTTNWYFIYIFK